MDILTLPYCLCYMSCLNNNDYYSKNNKTTGVCFRYLCSLVETILIYQHFKKPSTEPPGPKQELLDFWMDFLVEATKKDVSSVRFPV